VRVLVTGKGGKAGSWAVRGEQLGQAIGAEVMPMAETAEIRASHLVVVVKRTPPDVIQKIRVAGRPWVYDIVDAWPQPAGNAWSQELAVRWLRQHLAELAPTAVVFPTSRMLEDSGWRGPALVLPHHGWPKYEARAVAPVVRRVGYEGDPRYLGRWHALIEGECAARRWEFVVNGDLSTCDIGIALRDAPGYPAGAWKSNCKLANLQALGLPAVCSPEAGYREFGSGAEWFVESRADLSRAFGCLAHVGPRARAAERMVASAPRLRDIAEVYRTWLGTLRS
jgi:hypothetical protein